MASFPLLAFFLAATQLLCVQTQSTNTSVEWRLPSIIRPSNYQLHINVTTDVFSGTGTDFHGMVIITFTTIQTTNTIKLHASHDHLRLNLITIGNTDINQTDYSVDNVTDILTITLSSGTINVNSTYRMIIDFSGTLSTTEMDGFYRSSYETLAGETRYLATTQFQPTSARKAFPCFDEPSFKATFEIYITYPLGYNALSNTPGSLYTNDSVSETFQFELTSVMSTYLIAFVVSDFDCTAGEFIDNVPYQVCARVEANDTRGWALEVGPQLLRSLNTYTDFHYNNSKSKLDQVAVPDFAAGAMENWGLVTYREVYLLWDPVESSNSYKQFVATINAHEFAHFWFGNLVTCDWWSELFLNEGFATYFEYFTTHDVLPSWELDKQYVVDVVQSVLVNDALENALALQSEANSPTEILAKFGRISYYKGGAIFRMVEHIIGSTNFRTGLRNYLSEYQYGTALPENLWLALQSAMNNATAQLPANSLVEVMHNWVKNPGFPLLTVSVHNNEHVDIVQERFLVSGNDTSSRWYVPVSYTTSEDSNKFGNTAPIVWLTPTANASFHLPVSNSSWLVINNQQTGFFRVNYDSSGWNNIRLALQRENFDGIVDLNRAQLVDDLFNLARVNRVQYSTVFSTVQFLVNETSYFPWVPAISGLNFLLNRVGADSQLGQAISLFTLNLLEGVYNNVSFTVHDEDDQIQTLKQVLVLNTACRLGKSSCITAADVFFYFYRATGVRPPKNLRPVVYCNALRYSSDQTDWEFLWDAYTNSTILTEKTALISALGCSRDSALLNRYLNLSITEDSGIRSQDRLSVFNAVYNNNPVGVDVAFEFLINNHDRINEMYLSLNALPNLINGIAGAFTTKEQVERLQQFIETGGLPAEHLPSATIALEAAQANIEWVENFYDHLFDFFFTEPQTDAAPEVLGLHVMVAVLVTFVARLLV
ncbi:hypothetical protein NQ315_003107 [Exocentrus adspersus]|uniref:Aminopeptidase n=1 Tax=Exocentrus adspersus TaxID=1586481 RepID=A0AAV8W4R9_9CUCU|nr:hypothetical protein NQ315_003107 [Exocentrus adspersus]